MEPPFRSRTYQEIQRFEKHGYVVAYHCVLTMSILTGYAAHESSQN